MSWSRGLTGVAVVVMGGLFLLESQGQIWVRELIRGLWPLFILTVGLGTVVLLTERGAIVRPSIFIAAGLVLLGARLNIVSDVMLTAILPRALIAIGSAIMVDQRRGIGESTALHQWVPTRR